MTEETRAAPIRLALLGPLEVVAAGGPLDIGGLRQQTLLAALALSPHRTVPVDRLTTIVYGTEPPSTARAQVQMGVSTLRRLLGEHGRAGLIATRRDGYVLLAEDDQVDLSQFRALVAQGQAARDTRKEAALAAYRSALALWRGPALEGLHSEVLRAAAHRLDEERLGVREERMALELELGRHREVVAELTRLAADNPLRERLQAQLMLALYRAGRPAEALEVYRRARSHLVSELGIEPGAQLRELERAILTRDPHPGGRSVTRRPDAGSGSAPGGGSRPEPGTKPAAVQGAAPRLLPTDVADFTARDTEIAAIDAGLHAAPAGPAVRILALSGRPGVGKTTLAVHVGHRLAERYRDGQLFAALRSPSGRPVDPADVLGRFLRVLGVPGAALPDGVEARADLYRHLLAGRRALVVLDNAAGEDQIVPLLPGASPSAVLVTGRHRLAALPGAVHVEVELLEPAGAVDLLGRMVGADRIRAEPHAAATLAELCDHLPLALRIAGARLIARPHWSIESLAHRLSDRDRRLEELEHGPLGVRAGLSLSYQALSPDGRRLLRRLALPDFPRFCARAAAALVDCDQATAGELLDELADARLLEVDDHGRRYRWHDLVRGYARERLLAEDPPAERTDALGRVRAAAAAWPVDDRRR